MLRSLDDQHIKVIHILLEKVFKESLRLYLKIHAPPQTFPYFVSQNISCIAQ